MNGDDGRQPKDISQKFKRIKSRHAALREMTRLAGDVDLAEEGKNYWRTKAQQLDIQLRGRTLILAALVHQCGGEAFVTAESLGLMESGDYLFNQNSTGDEDAPQLRLVTTYSPKNVDPEENEAESGRAGDSEDNQPSDPGNPE